MTLTLCLLFQLWTQPSVRTLGLGYIYADFVPDLITDIIRNPAYLKLLDGNAISYFPQVYTTMRSYNSTSLTKLQPGKEYFEFYRNDELMSIHILDSKIGLAGRFGTWQRMVGTTYPQQEVLRLYGQSGFLGAINITNLITFGGEYNFSWNNRPDDFVIKDINYANISEKVWSNEMGFGIILAPKHLLEISISGKKNFEKENFVSDIPFPFGRGPEGLLTSFEANSNDLQFTSKLKYSPNNFTHVANFNCYRKRVVRDGVNHTNDYYLTTLRPGIGTVFCPSENVLTIAALSYQINNIDDDAYPSYTDITMVIGLMGFEAQLSRIIKFRFGNTLFYMTAYEWNKYKDDVSFGIDIMPSEKLILNIATQNPLDYAYWFFSVSFRL